MDKESRASRNVRLQHAHTFVSRVPALYHDVVQFFAKEFVDNILILSLHFKEVGKCAYRRKSTGVVLRALCIRTEDVAHRISRIAVFANSASSELRRPM